MTIRILHALHWMTRGGIATGVKNVVSGLTPPEFGHVIVVSARDGESDDTLPPHRYHAVPSCPWYVVYKRIHAIRKLIVSHKIDIVHGRGWPGVDALIAGSSVPGVRLVFSDHGQSDAGPRAYAMHWRLTFRLLGPRISYAFALSPELRLELAKMIGWDPSNVKIIPNGVDTDRFRPFGSKMRAMKNGRFRLGMASGLRPVKRPDMAIRLIRRIVSERGPDSAELDIAGDGPMLETLRNEVESAGIGKNVLFRGHVSDMPRWYGGLHAFLLPSDFEGCSNVILEAMAGGIPVIATDVGLNRFLLKNDNAGHVVPVGNFDGLKTAVDTYLDEPEKARECGMNARKLASEHHALATMCHAYSQMYRSVCSGNPPNRHGHGRIQDENRPY